MINLTRQQLECLPAIEWLIDGGGRSGRSFLIAFALFQRAVKSGRWTVIFDHDGMPGASQVTHHIVGMAKDAKVEIEVDGNRFRVTRCVNAGHAELKTARS